MGRAGSSKAAVNGARMNGARRNDEIVARNMRRFRIARGLTLQLLFCFEVRALSDRLVSSTPE